MKTIATLPFLVSAALAHYTFNDLIFNGKTTGDWEYVRETENHYSNGPVTDVTSESIRCYQLASGSENASTAAVQAGATVGFKLDTTIIHPGPLSFYMAKAPEGQTAESWDGSGANWFKIWEEHPNINSSGLQWPDSNGKSQVSVKVPQCLAEGYYLLRAEHIALHGAGTSGGAQFYLACAQLHVSGGTDVKTPSDLGSFPGMYKATDPGILINIYYPVPTNYTNPGVSVFSC